MTNRTILIGNKYTFKNKKTDEICERKFDDAQDVENGWARVLVNDKYTFFNPYTDKFCGKSFDRAASVEKDSV